MSNSPDRVMVRVKRFDDSRDIALPSYESEGASGLDLRAAVDQDLTLQPGEIKLVPTGLAISLPVGYEAQIRPRSGLALKHGVGMAQELQNWALAHETGAADEVSDAIAVQSLRRGHDDRIGLAWLQLVRQEGGI